MTKKGKSKPILVPVDFSSHSESALLCAAELAETLGSELVILHVVHDPGEAPGYYSVKGRDKQMRRMEDVAAEMLEEFLHKLQKKHPGLAAMQHATTMLVVGLPVNRILESAEKIQARMIVMGSQGRTGLAHAMLGSKAEQVVRLASVPVMIVKDKKQKQSPETAPPAGRVTGLSHFRIRPGRSPAVITNIPREITMLSNFRLAVMDKSTPRLLLPALAALPHLRAPRHSPQSATAGEIDWLNMGMKLLGGLALFLFGMEQMADALKAVAGERMKIILAKLTTNRFMGAATGAFVTAIIQSSSVTTVLVVGFITAGLMSMAQSIGVIMGANIGTTITAQIVAFKVTKFALLMIAAGFGMLFFSKQEKIKQYGGMLMGLGLVFFGMSVMSDAMSPLRSYQPFLDLMTRMENPLIGILVAAGFTGPDPVVLGNHRYRHRHGYTGVYYPGGGYRTGLRRQHRHLCDRHAGVYRQTPRGRPGRCSACPVQRLWRAAVGRHHPPAGGAGDLVVSGPSGTVRHRQTRRRGTAADRQCPYRLQYRQYLYLYRLHQPVCATGGVAGSGQAGRRNYHHQPKYLDEELLETPSLALDRVRLEIGHMGDRINEMMERIMPAVAFGNAQALKDVARIDDEVDILHGHASPTWAISARRP